jgi:hypothetical protein
MNENIYISDDNVVSALKTVQPRGLSDLNKDSSSSFNTLSQELEKINQQLVSLPKIVFDP